MELAVVAGLGLIGSYIANNKEDNIELLNEPITENKKFIDKYEKDINNVESNEIKLFPTEINTKVHHLYDTQIVPKLKNNYYDKAKDQREKSKIPERTNIIPPFFNIKNDYIMGSVPSNELLNSNNDSYDNQFNLQSIDNKGEPASIGDLWDSNNNTINLQRSLEISKDFSPFESFTNDMTYGITQNDKFIHNNMQFNSSQRDIGNTESNNFEYKMEMFSGSSKNWNPKREILPFFDPEEYKQLPFKNDLKVDEERDRLFISRIKQNEKPFEPENIQPGLNLDYNESSNIGFHDTFRAMPHDTNALRTANKPKLTYDGRIEGAPRKGEKRGITAPMKKRRPEQWRYQTVDDLVANRAITTGQTVQGKYILPDNARMANNCELKGPAMATTQVGPDNREGKVKITKRITHVEDKLGPKAPDQFNPNNKSFNILDNQRKTTNYNIPMQPSKNQHIKSFNPNDLANSTIRQTTNEPFNTHNKPNQNKTIAFDPSDIAKSTIRQTLTNEQFNTMTRQLLGNYSNLSDQAKMTIKQILISQTYEQIIQSAQHNAYSNLSDNAKNTLKQVLTLCQFNTHNNPLQKETYTNLSDTTRITTRQILSVLENNNMIQSGQHNNYTNLTDTTKTTIRQTLTEEQFNTSMRQLINSYTNLTDKSKRTLKEILTKEQFNTNIGNNQKNPYSNLSDEAKNTLKQILSLREFNTNINSLQQNPYSNFSDISKHTIREILTLLEFNNNMKSNQKEGYTNLQDLAKTTIRETLTESEFNTFLSRTINSYSNLTDEAKHTIKEILSTQNLETIIGSANKQGYCNLSDKAKSTLKQLLTLQTFSNFIKQNIGTYSNLSDEAKHTIRELLTIFEYNNNIGSAHKEVYTELMDLAKHTIKEFIAITELNNNVGTIKKEIAFNPDDLAKITDRQDLDAQEFNNQMGTIKKEIAFDSNDLAKITHKQDLLNENYMGTILNSSSGVQQVSFDIAPTQKDMNKAINYNSAAYSSGINRETISTSDARNMRQNITKEVIAEGRYPTLSNAKQGPTRKVYDTMEQNIKPNYNVIKPPTLFTKINLEDRDIFNTQNLKNKVEYDVRLYEELLEQLNDNPLVNNVNSIFK